MATEFLNENLIPGKLGQAFIVLSFVASLFSAIAFIVSTQSKLVFNQESWKRLAQNLFVVHAFSTFGIFFTLFYLIFNHNFEYFYVWSHSSKQLPFKYLLSCFWEGQEGSFLLWSIWHAILGLILLFRKTSYQAPVMAIVALCQAFLATTLLGYFFFDMKIGSSPFMLLRDQMQGAPIFQQANYLEFIQDGNGLNPLLQNYWMVIHPPILFLGFASTLFPFAYALAAMWKKQYEGLPIHLLRWSVFSGMILGTGIMMGGMWAYESLNFGGYWAWDPVENASLVPWLIMIAGLHTTMIYKASGYSLKTTLLFFILSFCLVLYSTFLTRTGILGETSVHSFTGEGETLFYHLLVFLFFFLLLGLFLFFKNYKSIPDLKKEEEAATSREFWMFIGALILMISVVQITYTTSMPVWNKMFGTKYTIVDPITHYNKIQVWISSLVLLGTASIYYFKFKHSNLKEVLKKISVPLATALVLTTVIAIVQKFTHPGIVFLLFSSWLTIVSMLWYIITVLKSKIIKWGGTVAHLGFGMMLLGILFSGYNKRVVSVNRLGADLGIGKTPQEKAKESRENVLLYRNIPITMYGYNVTYQGDTVEEPNHFYKVLYQKLEHDTGKVVEEFELRPNAQINPKMGLVSSPDSRHYLTHDIFTYVTTTLDKSKIKDTVGFTVKKMKKGDSVAFEQGTLVFEQFDTEVKDANYTPETNDVAVCANLGVYNKNGQKVSSNPIYFLRGQQEFSIPDTVAEANLITRLDKILPDEGAAIIAFKQPDVVNDYITMKAIVFPWINVLWVGTVFMVIGFFISLWKRLTQ